MVFTSVLVSAFRNLWILFFLLNCTKTLTTVCYIWKRDTPNCFSITWHHKSRLKLLVQGYVHFLSWGRDGTPFLMVYFKSVPWFSVHEHSQSPHPSSVLAHVCIIYVFVCIFFYSLCYAMHVLLCIISLTSSFQLYVLFLQLIYTSSFFSCFLFLHLFIVPCIWPLVFCSCLPLVLSVKSFVFVQSLYLWPHS